MIRLTTLLVLGLCSVAAAQYPETGAPGTITGTGSSTIELQPDRLRLQIDVLYRGPGLKAALEGLEKQKATARTKLVALGADKDSIKFKSPRITSSQSAKQQQMMEMMQQRLNARRGGAGAKKNAAKKKAEPVVVSASLTAEWKLDGKPAEVLVKTHELKKTVAKADLSGQKQATALSPEQQELLDEAQQEYGGYSDREESPGEPTFVFVTKVPDDQRDKAMAEAFQKARKQAERLAGAAGMTPGPLAYLQGSGTSVGGGDDDYSGYGGYRSRSYGSSSAEGEATGRSFGPIKYVVNVVAGFAIGKKK